MSKSVRKLPIILGAIAGLSAGMGDAYGYGDIHNPPIPTPLTPREQEISRKCEQDRIRKAEEKRARRAAKRSKAL